jgi:predicted flap endonuclease-1-like 5' DNA nuclease
MDFPLWAWILILPGLAIVAALIVRRLSERQDGDRLPFARPEDAQEFRLESAGRRVQPQSAEVTHFAAEAEDTGEIAGPVNRQAAMEAAETATSRAEMKTSTVSEEARVAEEADTKAARPGKRDDLKVVEGIGPKIESILNKAGITTFDQLAQSTPERLYEILHDANLRLADPTTWPEQARLADGDNWDMLKALQDRLQAGRRSIEE